MIQHFHNFGPTCDQTRTFDGWIQFLWL